MNLTGIWMGLLAAVAVGLGFVWVIKLEYYVGAHIAWAVAVVGLILILASLFVPGFLPSAIMGILGGTIVWGAIELPQQEERAARGLFPVNPRRQAPEREKQPVVEERETKVR
jgi:hypothetical protein